MEQKVFAEERDVSRIKQEVSRIKKQVHDREQEVHEREEKVSGKEQRAFDMEIAATNAFKSVAEKEKDLKKREGAVNIAIEKARESLGKVKELKERLAEERTYLDSLSKTSKELGIGIKPEEGERFDSYFGRFLGAVAGLKPRKRRQLKEGSYDFTVDKDGSYRYERKKPVDILKPRKEMKLAEGVYSLTVGKDGSYKCVRKTEAPKVVEQAIVEAEPVVRIQRSGVKDLFYATAALEDLRRHPMKEFIKGLKPDELTVKDDLGVRLRGPRDKLVGAFREAGYRIKNLRNLAVKPEMPTVEVAQPPKKVKKIPKKPTDTELDRFAQEAGKE